MSFATSTLIVVLALFYNSNCQGIPKNEQSPPVYNTRYGKVEGFWQTSFDGRQYAAFEGIPYAKPPVGELKFEEPQPIKPWTGVWRATTVNKCLQSDLFYTDTLIGDEDCLYLNIYVPVTGKTSKLDVIIHIHGGGFAVGYGKEYTNAKYLMDRDIIFVTLQYRLGALGFLSTGDDILPGNNGLKDQVMAMKWIKENIDSFGGDSNSITITGFSAGAASVHLHYFSPLSRNLFNRGISMSGSALNSFAMQYNPSKRAEALARALRCESSNKRIMIDCIKSRPASLILNVTMLDLIAHKALIQMPFVPVVEQKSETAFLLEHPYKLLKQGKVLDVPWMASITVDEGLVLSIPSLNYYNDFDENWDRLAKYILIFEDTVPENKETYISRKIKKYYLTNGNKLDTTNFKGFTKMLTDRLIGLDSQKASKMQAKVTKSPVFYYMFQYESVNGFKKLLTTESIEGTCHGDDMVYFFGGMINKPLSEQDIKLKDTALDILYSFAHQGEPTIPNITWRPIGEEFNFLNISGPNDIKLDIKTDFSTEEFWKNLGLLENENLFSNVKTEL